MSNNANILPNDETDLKPGEIRFYDNFRPKIAAGSGYMIEVEQLIEGDGLAPQSFTRAQKFEVAGPRFCLPEGEIHSVYPPPNINDDYDGVLPQIVFRKRQLPWERSADGKTPWMALLLLDEAEIIVPEGSDGVSRTRAVSYKTADVIAPKEEDYLKPILTDELSDEENCFAINLSKENFLAIAPRFEELADLAHVREVNTDHKEFLGMHADGWFSILLSNRLPKTPPELASESIEAVKGAKFARNIVHLVSLEGFTEYLKMNLDPESEHHKTLEQAEHVRLASLASWEFYCKSPTEGFAELMENLESGMLKSHLAGRAADSFVNDALEGGYVPLQYHTRMGEQTMAWYRGPLLPIMTEANDAGEDVFFSVESAQVYDEQTGIFDLSHAAAWQIGRLTALSDAHFAQTLLEWKQLTGRKINEFIARQEIEAKKTPAARALTREDTDVHEIKKLMGADYARSVFFEGFLGKLETVKEAFGELNFVADQIDKALAGFPGILDRKDLENMLQDGQEPVDILRKKLFES